MAAIKPEDMVFIDDDGIGAVREVRPGVLIVFVENAGEFPVPIGAVRAAHDGKVVLAPEALDRRLLEAIGHRHDREDPRAAG